MVPGELTLTAMKRLLAVKRLLSRTDFLITSKHSKNSSNDGERRRLMAVAAVDLTLLCLELLFLHPKVGCQIRHDIPLAFGRATHHRLERGVRVDHS